MRIIVTIIVALVALSFAAPVNAQTTAGAQLNTLMKSLKTSGYQQADERDIKDCAVDKCARGVAESALVNVSRAVSDGEVELGVEVRVYVSAGAANAYLNYLDGMVHGPLTAAKPATRIVRVDAKTLIVLTSRFKDNRHLAELRRVVRLKVK